MIINKSSSERPRNGASLGVAGIGLSLLAIAIGLQVTAASQESDQTSQTVQVEAVDGQPNTEVIHYDLNGEQGSVQYFCAPEGEGHYGASGSVTAPEGFSAQQFVNALGSQACYNGVASADSREALVPVAVGLADEAMLPDAFKAAR